MKIKLALLLAALIAPQYVFAGGNITFMSFVDAYSVAGRPFPAHIEVTYSTDKLHMTRVVCTVYENSLGIAAGSYFTNTGIATVKIELPSGYEFSGDLEALDDLPDYESMLAYLGLEVSCTEATQ